MSGGGFSHSVKRLEREANHSLPYITNVKNVELTSTYFLTGWRLIKGIDKFLIIIIYLRIDCVSCDSDAYRG
jgi:hypothetical protein